MRLAIAIILALAMFSFIVAKADTIHVPADYLTIQEAIDAAAHGDTVLVAPGTYLENINFFGKKITVISSGGPEVTVIDGGVPSAPQFGSVVTFRNHENADSVLQGFNLTKGRGTLFEDEYCGGGVFCLSSRPTLRDNIIYGNTAISKGGAICCWYCSPTITNNKIYANHASDGGGIYVLTGKPTITYNTIAWNLGSGIYCHDSDPVIRHNTITNNSAGYGGGIYCYTSQPDMTYNIISENSASKKGGGIFCHRLSPTFSNNLITGNITEKHGGGICCYDSSPNIKNNLIIWNTSERRGGGIFCYYSDLSISNNTFFGNSALECGGGICCTLYSSATVTNSILWYNSAPEGPGIWIGHPVGPSTLAISYSDLQTEGGTVFVGADCTYIRGRGMIEVDPLFVNSNQSDFHLTYDSSCRDAGDNSVITGLFDFEGDPRIAWNGTVDMGADEFYNHLYCTGDYSPGGSIEGKLIGLPDAAPVGLFVGTDVRDPAAPTAYGDFHILPPWIFVPLIPIPAQGILAIPFRIPSTPLAPYDVPMQGLIGLNSDSLTNLYVIEVR